MRHEPVEFSARVRTRIGQLFGIIQAYPIRVDTGDGGSVESTFLKSLYGTQDDLSIGVLEVVEFQFSDVGLYVTEILEIPDRRQLLNFDRVVKYFAEEFLVLGMRFAIGTDCGEGSGKTILDGSRDRVRITLVPGMMDIVKLPGRTRSMVRNPSRR